MRQQERSAETQARILQAAGECISERGYDATGVADICQRAGVSKGAFYHHFPSKQAVFLGLFSRWLAALDEDLVRARAGRGAMPEALLRMADVSRQVYEAGGGRLPIFLEFWTQAAHDPAVWQATIAPYRRYQAFFADMIRAGIAEGSLRPVDPEVAARVVLSLAIGLVLQGLLDSDGTDWGQVAQDGVRLLLEGLGKSDAGAEETTDIHSL